LGRTFLPGTPRPWSPRFANLATALSARAARGLAAGSSWWRCDTCSCGVQERRRTIPAFPTPAVLAHQMRRAVFPRWYIADFANSVRLNTIDRVTVICYGDRATSRITNPPIGLSALCWVNLFAIFVDTHGDMDSRFMPYCQQSSLLVTNNLLNEYLPNTTLSG
jgi:hypothetical protein